MEVSCQNHSPFQMSHILQDANLLYLSRELLLWLLMGRTHFFAAAFLCHCPTIDIGDKRARSPLKRPRSRIWPWSTLLPQRWHNFWAGDKNQQGVNKPIFCTYARLFYRIRVETSLISITKGFPLTFVSSCLLSHICNHFQITTNLNTQLISTTTINFMANDTRKKDWLTCGQIVVLILKSTRQLPL